MHRNAGLSGKMLYQQASCAVVDVRTSDAVAANALVAGSSMISGAHSAIWHDLGIPIPW
jgi:hypothetical protein